MNLNEIIDFLNNDESNETKIGGSFISKNPHHVVGTRRVPAVLFSDSNGQLCFVVADMRPDATMQEMSHLFVAMKP